MLPETANFEIVACSECDFGDVIKFIELLQLDNNDLNPSQFLVAKRSGKVIGFGRLRTYAGCSELCSLGVMEPFRNKGVGTALANELIGLLERPLFVVTIIPAFFERLGFVETFDFPKEIKVKMDYCTGSLPVEEAYLAMRLK